MGLAHNKTSLIEEFTLVFAYEMRLVPVAGLFKIEKS